MPSGAIPKDARPGSFTRAVIPRLNGCRHSCLFPWSWICSSSFPLLSARLIAACAKEALPSKSGVPGIVRTATADDLLGARGGVQLLNCVLRRPDDRNSFSRRAVGAYYHFLSFSGFGRFASPPNHRCAGPCLPQIMGGRRTPQCSLLWTWPRSRSGRRIAFQPRSFWSQQMLPNQAATLSWLLSFATAHRNFSFIVFFSRVLFCIPDFAPRTEWNVRSAAKHPVNKHACSAARYSSHSLSGVTRLYFL